MSRIGKLVPATDPPAGPRDVQVGGARLKRLQPGDLVVLVLAPDGRAVGRLIDL